MRAVCEPPEEQQPDDNAVEEEEEERGASIPPLPNPAAPGVVSNTQPAADVSNTRPAAEGDDMKVFAVADSEEDTLRLRRANGQKAPRRLCEEATRIAELLIVSGLSLEAAKLKVAELYR